jgi:hypothetical protein
MPLTVDFDLAATLAIEGAQQRKPTVIPAKRPAPFSIRLSESERSRLEQEAGGAPLGAYIKAKALGGEKVRLRRTGLTIQDREALARVLALLGSSRLANNLNQLAYAANIGALPFTPEVETELREAAEAVREMRALLLQALGLKPEEK